MRPQTAEEIEITALVTRLFTQSAQQIASPLVRCLKSAGFNVKEVLPIVAVPADKYHDGLLNTKPVVMPRIVLGDNNLNSVLKLPDFLEAILYSATPKYGVGGKYVKFYVADLVSQMNSEIIYIPKNQVKEQGAIAVVKKE